jgi:DNA-binding NarL/FixJ family response regulator
MKPAALMGGWRGRFLRVSDSGLQASSISEEVLMPARRELTIRQLRQMLRLHHDGVSAREIGRTLGVARSTIQDNLERSLVFDPQRCACSLWLFGNPR